MDGLTIVMLIAWLILLGVFAGIYILDNQAKNYQDTLAKLSPEKQSKRR